jgi:aspartate/tyrosine/aromatic aminotransferase
MFSLLGLAPPAIAALCEVEHVYMPPDGRINVAGVSDSNVDRVADSIVRVLDRQ